MSTKRSFEESLERLEEIADELEGGNLTLEEALRRFEEGVRLLRELKEELQRVDGEIRELLDEESV